MKRGSVFITFFLVIVLVIGSAEIVHASDNEKGVETFFIDLFNYLFTPINSPQFSMDIGGGGGGGGVIPACPYDCQSSCSSGQIEAAGSCLTPTVCCRDLNVCGDRYIDFGEDCDGSYLNGESCESKGYLSGTLSCVDCNFNEDDCILKSINLGLKFDFEEGIGNIAIDSSGNGNDGNIIDATYDKNSKVGLFSLNLDGNKDYINVSRSSSLMITDGLTMGAWVYPMNISSGWDYVIAKGFVNNSSPYLDYGLGWYNPYINGMVLRAVITINGSQSIVTSSLLDPNKWHHIVATYSSVDEELAMYVNGYLYNTTKASGIIEDSGTNLFIGMYEHITSESFNGSIDDVRIYDGALSAGEVLDYYNGVAVEVCDDGFCEGSENCSSCPEDCGDCPSISDLVLYMPFEGDFMDYSGNELNGNCFNCPTSTLGYDGNGSAYEFNGINDLITIADNDNLNLTSDFSVLVWTKFNNLMDNDPKTVLSKEHWVSDSENSGYAMEKYGINDLYFINYGNSDAGSNNVNIPTSEREWHHSAITYDYANNLLTFYEDGVEKSNNAAVANILENTNNLHIGASTAPDRWFDGAIDELRIYNRVLSLTEIQNFSLLPIVDCTDADDDGWIFESEGTCDTSAIPALNGYDDCDDGEPLKWNLYDLYNDLDLDSYGAGSVVEQSCWGQITDIEFINYLISNSFSYLDTDCDDNADYNFPNNPEICDGLDNDCGLDVDEGLICECFMEVDCYDSNECTNDFCDLQFINGSLCVNVNLIDGTLCTGGTCQKGECIINCMDIDGDGYNVTGGLCGPIDCNDFNGAINPGAVEICDDLLDNNCNNLTDCDDVSCSDDPVCFELWRLSCGRIGMH